MSVAPISGAALNFTGVANTHKADSPEKIKDAATQFEGLMIGQILKAVPAPEKPLEAHVRIAAAG